MKRIFISLLFLSQMSNAQVDLVKDIQSGSTGSTISGITEFNGKLYFRANDGSTGFELWKSDGTSAGTLLVSDFVSGGNFVGSPPFFTILGSKLYFFGNANNTGIEVYHYDGTNISLAADLKTGNNVSSAPGYMIEMGGNLYVRAQEQSTTTNRLFKINSSNSFNVVDNSIVLGTSNSAAVLDGKLYLAAGTVSSNQQLYSTDGTTMTLVKTINTAGNAQPTNFYAASAMGKVFFRANDGTAGLELWMTDGTETGTVLVKDIVTGSGTSSPANFYEYNGKVYFSANDGTNGVELWVTDGTSAGTQMLKDINTSVAGASSNPSNFYTYNGKLYFSANDGVNGSELWRTDGTAENTTMLFDINSGAGNSSPSDFISFNGDLYFGADNGSTGKELYKISASTLGLEKVKATSLKVYPNPSNGNINFSSPITGKYSLYTYAGNLVSSGFIAKQKELQLKVSSGNYLLVVDQNGDKKTFNIVVKN